MGQNTGINTGSSAGGSDILTSGGTTAPPSFANTPCGGLHKIARYEPTGTEVLLTSALDATKYSSYKLVISPVLSDASGSLAMTCSIDNGATWITTGSYRVTGKHYSLEAVVATNASVDNSALTVMRLVHAMDTSTVGVCTVHFQCIASAGFYGRALSCTYSTIKSEYQFGTHMINYPSATTVNALRISNSGNLTGTIIDLYGVVI